MYSGGNYLPPVDVGQIRVLSNNLNAKVVAQVNDTQELVMLNNFSRECNECLFKKCSRERISDIASWQWVLEDLVKRLNEAVEALEYEHNALRVVVQRVQDEIDEHSRSASRPGFMCPLSDIVEDAILQEFKFLRDHKKKFESMIPELENKIKNLNKTKKRIEVDILRKKQAISVEETCASKDVSSVFRLDTNRKKKKRSSPLCRWENRCASLKTSGLKALSSAAIFRQQVRGARTHLSIAAQAYAARVDSALRRRLHSNKIKLQDLKWQREEALRDYKSLDEEYSGIEENLIETMNQEQLMEARLVDRALRPPGELTKDEVDRKLRDELARLRCFSKHLRTNLERIRFSIDENISFISTNIEPPPFSFKGQYDYFLLLFSSLQNLLAASMTQIDCCIEDIIKVVCLDEERIKSRLGDIPVCTSHSSGPPSEAPSSSGESSHSRRPSESVLTCIKEEDEDDYSSDN